jgi:hypothetical protein
MCIWRARFFRIWERDPVREMSDSPAPRANGGAVLDLFASRRGHPAVDDAFEAQMDAALGGVSADLDADPWGHGGPDARRVSDL